MPPARPEGVHYTITGDGPRIVVLLHGFADNSCTWNRVLPTLAAEYRVIAVDLPGFGESVRRWGKPLLAGYVAAVREVLDAEAPGEAATLMGNSMGAAVAALFAAAHPDRTEGVVLIDMPGLGGVPKLWDVALSWPCEVGLRAALRGLPAVVPGAGLGWFYDRIAAADVRRLDPDTRRGFRAPYDTRGRMPDLLPIGRALLADLRAAHLAEVVTASIVPVLLVFGARDRLTPARVLRRVGHRDRAVVLPGCGHCPQLDRPDALLEHVLPFLRETALPATRVAEAV